MKRWNFVERTVEKKQQQKLGNVFASDFDFSFISTDVEVWSECSWNQGSNGDTNGSVYAMKLQSWCLRDLCLFLVSNMGFFLFKHYIVVPCF